MGNDVNNLVDIGTRKSYTNVVNNGDFANGITGWTVTGGTITEGKGYATTTGNGSTYTVTLERPLTMTGVNGKVFVASATFTTSATASAWTFDVVLFGAGGDGYSIRTLKRGGISPNQTYQLYISFKESELTSITRISVRHNSAKINSAAVNISNVMLLEGEASDIGLSSSQLAAKYPFVSDTNNDSEPIDSTGYVDVIKEGVAGDGVTDDSQAIQNVFSTHAPSGGNIFFAPRKYLINSDVTITSSHKMLRLVGYGAEFIGTGKIVLDNCRHFFMEGFDLKAIKLSLRGVWWSSFKDIDVGQLVVGDVVSAGSSDNHNYWNDFYRVGMGQLLLDVNRGHFNSNSFYSCYWRSDINHGFVTQYDYNIKVNAAPTMLLQNNNFYGCDLSYASVSPIYIDSKNPLRDSYFNFDKCYFDTLQPDINQNAYIVLKDCVAVSNYIASASLSLASRSEVSSLDMSRFAGWQPTSAHNFFKDGTFMTGIAGGVIVKDKSTVITYSSTGGPINGYVDIKQPLNAYSMTYFTAVVPVTGYYTQLLYVRNNTKENRLFRVMMNEQYFNVYISNTEWTRISICVNAPVAEGTKLIMGIYAVNNASYNIRVGCVGVMLGKQAQLMPVPDYKAYIDNLLKPK